jgi:hypothetical protein
MIVDWVHLNSHCKRTYVGTDFFIDKEDIDSYRPIRGAIGRYSIYRRGTSKNGCAELIGTAKVLPEAMNIIKHIVLAV